MNTLFRKKKRKKDKTGESPEEQKTEVTIGRLPEEVILEVFRYLDRHSLLAVSLTCKKWASLSRDSSFWERLGLFSPHALQGLRLSQKIKLRGHKDIVHCLLVWPQEKILLTGSYDAVIRGWNSSGKCVLKLRGHSSCVTILRICHQRLYSGSNDSTIRSWFQGKCIQVLRGHEGSIVMLRQWSGGNGREELLVSSSRDNTVRAWTDEGTCLFILRGHFDYVICLKIWCSTIWSGSSDGTVRLWEPLLDPSQEKVLLTHPQSGELGVCALKIDKERKVAYSSDGEGYIIAWSEDGKQLAMIKGHEAAILSLTLWNGSLVSASFDSSISLWNLSVDQTSSLTLPMILHCTRQLIGHKKKVWALKVWNNLLFSCSNDCNVNAWAPPSQESEDEKAVEKMSPLRSIPLRSVPFCMKVWNGLLFCGCCDHSVRGWIMKQSCSTSVCHVS